MTLRVRLLLVLVCVVAAGLVISDVVVYAQLRSFLVSRLDPELRAASYQVPRLLYCEAGVARPGRRACSPSTHDDDVQSTGLEHPGGGLFPAGTFGELVGRDGAVMGRPRAFFYGARPPKPPVLPRSIPRAATAGAYYFTARSAGADPVSYRVMARRLPFGDLSVVVAVPLTEVDQTLRRLALAMMLVSAGVLAGLGVLAWWIVRRGLRPLEHMAVTADAIAAGGLGPRVTPADERTEVGRLGLALNAMLGRIETAFAARSTSELRLRRFLADASHELRTPLTSIRGYAEIFDLGARERPEDLATAMRRIREEADRMNVLVDDLLLLARLDHERPVDLRPLDLVPVVTDAVEAARAGAPDHPVVLVAPVSAPVLGDQDRLRQVVDNLLHNALGHSPPGAPVTVDVTRTACAAEVSVTDHGPGVQEKDVHRIFEPFFRADASRTRATGGAGLGLAIVAAITEAHGGAVGVESSKGGGARFWVRILGGGEAPGSDGEGGGARHVEAI